MGMSTVTKASSNLTYNPTMQGPLYSTFYSGSKPSVASKNLQGMSLLNNDF